MGAHFVRFATFGGMFGQRKVDFLIIGAQKCGTSSLYKYICENLMVNPARQKEVHYFDFQSDKSKKWYHRHFDFAKGKITGEASPFYIFHPDVPKRVRYYNPKMKLIAILRNPVERAISHYKMNVESERETLFFSDAIRNEEKRLKSVSDFDNKNSSFQHYSYKKRGQYFEQIKNWQKCFPKEQILVLNFNDFIRDPWQEIQKVYHFLDVAAYHGTLQEFHFNSSDHNFETSQEDRTYLKRYFAESNRLLKEHYHIDFE